MTPYLPQPSGVFAVLVTWGIGAVLLLAGAGLAGRRLAPEIQIGAGWGGLCLVLTLCGVFLPFDLRIPALLFAAAALAVLLLPRRRPQATAVAGLVQVLALSAPLWLVMAPIRPSQPDTFLNLLPNAFYLVDYARLPTAASPPSFSLLPAAPYNTQFLSYLGAFADADYPASGMSLGNVMLLLLAGLAIARALDPYPNSSAAPPSWSRTALGMLLATLFNPGFVPRIDFAAYGEPGLATTALFSAQLFVLAQGDLATSGRPSRGSALALILMAMIDVKQSGVGLVAALAAAFVVTSIAERGVPSQTALRFAAMAVLPALLIYAVWRWHVVRAGVAELQPLPFAEWNWRGIGSSLASAGAVVVGKPWYFGSVVVAMSVLPTALSRHGWTPTTRLLTFFAALFVFYNIFLIFMYLAVFPATMSGAAHSFFRYNTHLSLVLVLALALAVRDLLPAARRRAPRFAAVAILAVAIFAPVAFAKRLRFDLDMPQPLVWDLAKHLAPYLEDGDHLALLLPGDNDSVATMLAGVLADTPPRLRRLVILRRPAADPAALDDAARRGYSLALISCSPSNWVGVPSGQAVLLRHDRSGWQFAAAWPYPKDPGGRWQHILAWAPLCRRN